MLTIKIQPSIIWNIYPIAGHDQNRRSIDLIVDESYI